MANQNSITNSVKFGQRYIAGVSSRVVSAEDLHSWLGTKTRFRSWIERRIKEYGFVDNQDYLLVEEKGASRGRPLKTYWLTVDVAKELSMLEKNEKGREARKYFLACEKAAKEALKQSHQLPAIEDISVKQAHIVVCYANGDIETMPFTDLSVNTVCRHLLPDSVLVSKNAVTDALAPIQEGMAAGLALWADIGATLKVREVSS